MPTAYFLSYFIFFSALIVTIRSDLETMLMSRFVTIFLLPIAFLLASLKLLPITLTESIIGALLGYTFLFIVARVFSFFTGKDGIGQGDLELLAFIGSFLGIIGCWISLFIGSLIGSISGIIYIILFGKKHTIKLPFGPFLACGAISYTLFHRILIAFLFNQ
jgi:leader peptidase (prepilin peptidase)/N-methyltransferase